MSRRRWSDHDHYLGPFTYARDQRVYPVLPADEGEFEETVIRSEPWLLGHGAAVVKVEGRSGGVSIKHVFPLNIEPIS